MCKTLIQIFKYDHKLYVQNTDSDIQTSYLVINQTSPTITLKLKLEFEQHMYLK